MPSVFKRTVQRGRVALITYGPDSGNLAVIVDVIDQARALVDIFNPNPKTEKDKQIIRRQSFPYRRMVLTPIALDVKEWLEREMTDEDQSMPVAKKAEVAKLFEEQNILEKWNSSSWAKKIEQRRKRADLTDFQRFQVQKLKAQRRLQVTNALHKAKTSA